MSTRLRTTLVGGLGTLAIAVLWVVVFVDGQDRGMYFVWVPLVVTTSVLVDYFVWRRPERVNRLEAERNRPRYFPELGDAPTRPSPPRRY